MSIPRIAKAMDHIDDDLVTGAIEYKRTKKKNSWMKWGAMAACLCLVVVGAFIAHNLDDGALDYVETVIYSNSEYVVCGEGEANILEECGLPTEITEELAGKHLGYLAQAEKNTYYISEGTANRDVELFEYAPKPNDNVYILRIDGEYYAVIRRDSEGYHGLTDNEAVNILPLAKVNTCTQEVLDEYIVGISREELLVAWGEPDGHLSGFFGETWRLDNERDEHIIVYYDKDGTVENVKVSNLSE